MSPTGAGLGRYSGRPLRVDVDLVLIPVTVADARNRPVLELSKRDFGLYDSGKRQDIKYFFAEAAPISIGLILDFSKSMENKIECEREAVVQFLNNANPEDDYFAIAVSSKPQLIADTTDSLDQLQSKIGRGLRKAVRHCWTRSPWDWQGCVLRVISAAHSSSSRTAVTIAADTRSAASRTWSENPTWKCMP